MTVAVAVTEAVAETVAVAVTEAVTVAETVTVTVTVAVAVTEGVTVAETVTVAPIVACRSASARLYSAEGAGKASEQALKGCRSGPRLHANTGFLWPKGPEILTNRSGNVAGGSTNFCRRHRKRRRMSPTTSVQHPGSVAGGSTHFSRSARKRCWRVLEGLMGRCGSVAAHPTNFSHRPPQRCDPNDHAWRALQATCRHLPARSHGVFSTHEGACVRRVRACAHRR